MDLWRRSGWLVDLSSSQDMAEQVKGVQRRLFYQKIIYNGQFYFQSRLSHLNKRMNEKRSNFKLCSVNTIISWQSFVQQAKLLNSGCDNRTNESLLLEWLFQQFITLTLYQILLMRSHSNRETKVLSDRRCLEHILQTIDAIQFTINKKLGKAPSNEKYKPKNSSLLKQSRYKTTKTQNRPQSVVKSLQNSCCFRVKTQINPEASPKQRNVVSALSLRKQNKVEHSFIQTPKKRQALVLGNHIPSIFNVSFNSPFDKCVFEKSERTKKISQTPTKLQEKQNIYMASLQSKKAGKLKQFTEKRQLHLGRHEELGLDCGQHHTDAGQRHREAEKRHRETEERLKDSEEKQKTKQSKQRDMTLKYEKAMESGNQIEKYYANQQYKLYLQQIASKLQQQFQKCLIRKKDAPQRQQPALRQKMQQISLRINKIRQHQKAIFVA